MGSFLLPVVTNIYEYMEHFEKLALDSAQQKPWLWLRYIDNRVLSGLMAQSDYKISSATSIV
jgi:hypothetical protein